MCIARILHDNAFIHNSFVFIIILLLIIFLVPISGTLSVKEISLFKIQSWNNGYFQLIEGILYHFGSEVLYHTICTDNMIKHVQL